MRILVLFSGSWTWHLISLVWASESSSEKKKKKGVGDQQFLICLCITITWLFYKSTCLGQHARTIQSKFLGVEPTEQSCWELPKWHQCAAKVENWAGGSGGAFYHSVVPKVGFSSESPEEFKSRSLPGPASGQADQSLRADQAPAPLWKLSRWFIWVTVGGKHCHNSHVQFIENSTFEFFQW